jgi:hypothetical protein
MQKLEPLDNLVHDTAGDGGLASGKADFSCQIKRSCHRQSGEVGDGQTIHFHGQALWPQALPITYRARRSRHVVEQEIAIAV